MSRCCEPNRAAGRVREFRPQSLRHVDRAGKLLKPPIEIPAGQEAGHLLTPWRARILTRASNRRLDPGAERTPCVQNAIRVEIDGLHVGYVSKGNARKYAKHLDKAIAEGWEPRVRTWVGCHEPMRGTRRSRTAKPPRLEDTGGGCGQQRQLPASGPVRWPPSVERRRTPARDRNPPHAVS